MYYGGDYNPEQWSPEVWREDVRLMREAGVTYVSLGIFAWARLQPAEGEHDFTWLDEVLGLLHEGGIAVNLATATASPPAWAVQAYPDILPVDRYLRPLEQGSRQHFSPCSPSYKRLASDLVRALGERYKDHPAVVMWHVNNEYGCHVKEDFSPQAQAEFRVWLEDRYGDIEGLNRAWGTPFWGQLYTAFEQVVIPNATPSVPNTSAVLDAKRFFSDQLLGLYTMERDVLRRAGCRQPISTNFMGGSSPVDYWRWAQEVDLVWDDCYPDPHDPQSFRSAALTRDLMRSLGGGKPWLLMEQAPSAVNWREHNASKRPGQMAAWSMQAVGRGADGICFFQWRQARHNFEKYHSAMLPHGGTGTRTFEEVCALGRDLAALPELGESHDARIAMVFEYDGLWALQTQGLPTAALSYVELCLGWYGALHAQHHQVDMVQTTSDLGAYDLVIAPSLYLLTEAGAANLLGFAERGGTLVTGAFSDIVDELDAVRIGGYGTLLGAASGYRQREVHGLMPVGSGGPGEQTARFSSPAGDLTGTTVIDELEVTGAEVLGTFTEGIAAGYPALTRAQHGEGTIVHVCSVPDADGHDALVRWVTAEAGVAPVIESDDPLVEAARRGEVVTLINHSATDTVEVAVAGENVLTGEQVTSVTLAPFAYALVRTAGA